MHFLTEMKLGKEAKSRNKPCDLTDSVFPLSKMATNKILKEDNGSDFFKLNSIF